MSWFDSTAGFLGQVGGFADDVLDIANTVNALSNSGKPPKKVAAPALTSNAQSTSNGNTGMSNTTIMLLIAAAAALWFFFFRK